jgi:hypothetical protein
MGRALSLDMAAVYSTLSVGACEDRCVVFIATGADRRRRVGRAGAYCLLVGYNSENSEVIRVLDKVRRRAAVLFWRKPCRSSSFRVGAGFARGEDAELGARAQRGHHVGGRRRQNGLDGQQRRSAVHLVGGHGWQYALRNRLFLGEDDC